MSTKSSVSPRPSTLTYPREISDRTTPLKKNYALSHLVALTMAQGYGRGAKKRNGDILCILHLLKLHPCNNQNVTRERNSARNYEKVPKRILYACVYLVKSFKENIM